MKSRAFVFLSAGSVLGLFTPAAYALDFPDFSTWISNLSLQVPALMALVVAIGYVSGFALILGAIFRLKMVASQTSMMSQQYTYSGPLIQFGVGVALMFFVGFVQVGSDTLFGEDSLLNYQGALTGFSGFDSIISPVLKIVALIGYIAFLRGFFLLSRMGHQGGGQPGTLSKAILHLVGGILAINFEATWSIIVSTLTG